MCEGCVKVDRLHGYLTTAEDAISKAIGISYPARMARAEANLRDYFLKMWNIRARQATKEAARLARKLKPAREITAAVRRTMNLWQKDVKQVFQDEFTRIYRMARIAGWKQATRQSAAKLGYSLPPMETPKYNPPQVKVEKVAKKFLRVMPTFDATDRQAIKALAKQHQVFWIGDHYDANVNARLTETVNTTIFEAGRRTQVAGRLMEDRTARELAHVRVPGGFHGTQAQYFDGLVANAANVGRVHGQMRSFIDMGITKYQIMANGDDRTCGPCSHMDGKVHSVHHGAAQMENELNADSPADVKKVHPWVQDSKPGMDKLKEVSPNPGPQKGRAAAADSKSLADAGLALPPFHFRCRCTVEVTWEAGSFEPGPEADKPKIPKPPGVKKTPKKPPITKPVPKGQRPREFPKLPKSPTTPMQPFSVTRLVSGFKKRSVKTGRLTKAGKETIRREVNSILAKEECYNHDIGLKRPNAHTYSVRGAGRHGVHYEDGKILMPESGMTGAQRFFIAAEQKELSMVTKTEIWGAETLVHETIHGHSPLGKNIYYGWGAVMEEAQVHTATHTTMWKQFGLEIPKMQRGFKYDGYVRSTKRAIQSSIKENFGDDALKAYDDWVAAAESGDGATEIIGEAALRMRKAKVFIEASDDFLKAWVDEVRLPSDVTAGMTRDELVKKMDKFKETLFHKTRDGYRTQAYGVR